LREYLERYGKSEAWATGIVFLLAAVIYRLKGGLLLAILSATIADPVVFYSVAYLRNRKHETRWQNGVKRLVMEHSGAGTLNALLVRPALLAWFISHSNVFAGTVAGKFCADAIFYFASAPMYELSKRYIPRRIKTPEHEEDA
jgi:hypothetical protein